MRSTEALFIGGRSGVGKSTVAFEVHEQLTQRAVAHCVIEGDNLDLAYPPPWEHRLAERNLAAIWRNYRTVGQHRMVYVNTASVLAVDELVAAMGDDPNVTAVLLTATDGTARERLAGRELGSGLERHVRRSDEMSPRTRRRRGRLGAQGADGRPPGDRHCRGGDRPHRLAPGPGGLSFPSVSTPSSL